MLAKNEVLFRDVNVDPLRVEEPSLELFLFSTRLLGIFNRPVVAFALDEVCDLEDTMSKESSTTTKGAPL